VRPEPVAPIIPVAKVPLPEAPVLPPVSVAVAAPASAPVAPADFLRRLAQAAGVSEQVFLQQNPDQVADQLGAAMRLLVENVRQLLNARLEAKRLARSANPQLSGCKPGDRTELRRPQEPPTADLRGDAAGFAHADR
jgi:type VI secretion system protein ImpI